jgi:predicted RNA-binding protein Jag
VASSSAWDSKAGVSAWWVNADQVSKSAPTGDFLPIGSFMIRGNKNFLPPTQLLLGFGVMFQISEESKAKHIKHRLRDDEMSVVNPEGSVSLAESSVEISLHNSGDSDNSIIGEEGDNYNALEGQNSTGGDSVPLQLLVEEGTDRLASNLELNAISDSEKFPKLIPEKGNNERYSVQVNENSAINPDGEGLDSGSGSESSENEEQRGSISSVASPATSKQKGPKPLPRGKRSKAKKIAAKYKDQDEEDRLLVRAITGATLGREKAEAEAKARAQREAEAAFQKERRRAQHQRIQKETAQHEEVRKAMLEEGTENLNDEEDERTTDFDAFVGTPLPGDEILEAIPICAPWAALVKYKYKAKLQPGAQKKGKAVKEILSRWVETASKSKAAMDEESRDTEKMWPREVELVKSWKPEACVNCVPVSKVRVMMAGGALGAASKDSQGKGRGGKGSKKQK